MGRGQQGARLGIGTTSSPPVAPRSLRHKAVGPHCTGYLSGSCRHGDLCPDHPAPQRVRGEAVSSG